MKLIRWLLSNIILIAFVLALTYAYVYWDNLTGEDTPAGKVIAYLSVEYDEVREFLDGYDFGGDQASDVVEPEPAAAPDAAATASVPQVQPPGREPTRPLAQQPMPSPAVTQEPPARQQAYRPPLPDQAMMQQPPARQQAYRAPAPSPTMMQQPPARQQAYRPPVPDQAMTQQQPEPQQAYRPRVPDQAMIQPPPAPSPMPATRQPKPTDTPAASATTSTTGQPAMSTRELWIRAREEYHRGNIDESIRNYREVIAASTDNYDAYGELGNVYLRSGNNKEAANAYFEAAAILVKMGQVRRASSLLRMLGQLDRAKAEELNQLISSSNT